jgi:hypothetical protein
MHYNKLYVSNTFILLYDIEISLTDSESHKIILKTYVHVIAQGIAMHNTSISYSNTFCHQSRFIYTLQLLTRSDQKGNASSPMEGGRGPGLRIQQEVKPAGGPGRAGPGPPFVVPAHSGEATELAWRAYQESGR